MLRRFNFLFFALLVTSCATRPWVKHPMDEMPDVSCQTGSEAGYDIYIWKCFKNKKNVIFQKSAGLYSFPAQKQIAECAGETDFEKEIEFSSRNTEICNKRKPPEWILSKSLE